MCIVFEQNHTTNTITFGLCWNRDRPVENITLRSLMYPDYIKKHLEFCSLNTDNQFPRIQNDYVFSLFIL